MTEENQQSQEGASQQQANQPPAPSSAPEATQPVQPPAGQPQQQPQNVPGATQPQAPTGAPAQSPAAEQPQAPYGQAQPGATQPQVPYGQAQPGATQPQVPYGQTQPVVAPNQPGSGKALGALLCGIFAIVFSGTVIIGLALGIIAIVLASQYVKAFGKEGKATGGKICGIIGIVFSVFALIVYIATFSFAAVFVSSEEMQDSVSEAITESIESESSIEGLSSDEKEVEAAITQVLEGMKNLDSETKNEMAESFEEDFELYTDYKLSDVGIDLSEAVKVTANSIEYEIEDVYAFDDGTASAYATVHSVDLWDIFDSWISGLSAMQTSDISEDQIVQSFKEALNEASASEKFVSFDFKKVGSEWQVSQSDYEDELEYIYGTF